MAKAPVAGLAKTRLIPALGAEGAAALAARMLAHAVREALAAGLGPVTLCGAPDVSHPAFTALATDPRLSLHPQGEGDLGARMRRAFERALASCDSAVLIGTDAPDLDAAVLRAAADALATHDAVFAPAHDGGYALIGLRRAESRLFDAMPWSTSQVMAITRERLREGGLRWHELPPLHDIDEPADLVHLAGRGWA
ncbi:TIGR04282 family arsenosugar biosynthesis glycosyltransferase [Variovorax sp. YR752]|uniref:TIGR04282 family arsenosugar biosynthesis glycosyltransferase n=1 Tax=Variovorax sp. YR752 TaxID=1884383 RepID=UPI0031379F9B